jgi:glutathione S-transferase
MQFYYNPMSSNARRVMMTAAHLNTPLEMRLVTNMQEPVQRAELLRVNPNAKVPVLVDGDFVLWESCAIMQYLAENTPGQTLYPTELQARMDVHRWMFWNAQHWAPALGIFNWENHIKRWLGMGGADPAAIARGEAEVARFGAVLDAHLKGRQWMHGDTLSLADFTLATPLADIDAAKMPVTHFENLMAWLARVKELDAWKATQAGA